MIAFDTNIATYVAENNPEFANRAVRVIERAEQEGCRLSVVLVTELLSLVAPHHPRSISELEAFLGSIKNTEFIACTAEIARRATGILRAHRGIRLGDAIHLATAAEAGASEFWTNDVRLVKVAVPGVRVRLLAEAE